VIGEDLQAAGFAGKERTGRWTKAADDAPNNFAGEIYPAKYLRHTYMDHIPYKYGACQNTPCL
jgi:hypothetical protein